VIDEPAAGGDTDDFTDSFMRALASARSSVSTSSSNYT